MLYEGNNTTETDTVESLRRILEDKENRPISYDEALQIGDSLIEFYRILGEEAYDELAG